jgi:hypothetical protein
MSVKVDARMNRTPLRDGKDPDAPAWSHQARATICVPVSFPVDEAVARSCCPQSQFFNRGQTSFKGRLRPRQWKTSKCSYGIE